MSYRSDKTESPTAGTEKLDPLEFLARLVTHIPDKLQVMTRYCSWYANRVRGTRKKLAGEAAAGEQPIRVRRARGPDAQRIEEALG